MNLMDKPYGLSEYSTVEWHIVLMIRLLWALLGSENKERIRLYSSNVPTRSLGILGYDHTGECGSQSEPDQSLHECAKERQERNPGEMGHPSSPSEDLVMIEDN